MPCVIAAGAIDESIAPDAEPHAELDTGAAAYHFEYGPWPLNCLLARRPLVNDLKPLIASLLPAPLYRKPVDLVTRRRSARPER